MAQLSAKMEAKRILDKMPDNCTWNDLMYEFGVCEAIAFGLEDSDEGRTIDVKDIRAEFGLPE